MRAGSARRGSRRTPELAQRLRADGLPFPERDDWSSRFWSPISIAEAHWTRERVAMYDMTPLTRYEIAGAGAAAFLQRMTTNNVDKSVGSVTYTMLLDETGGIRSDITVARLARHPVPGRRQRADGLRLAQPPPARGGVTLRDITGGTCCVGVWGPLARDMVAAAVPRRPVAREVQVLPRTADLPRRDPRHHAAGVLCR